MPLSNGIVRVVTIASWVFVWLTWIVPAGAWLAVFIISINQLPGNWYIVPKLIIAIILAQIAYQILSYLMGLIAIWLE